MTEASDRKRRDQAQAQKQKGTPHVFFLQSRVVQGVSLWVSGVFGCSTAPGIWLRLLPSGEMGVAPPSLHPNRFQTASIGSHILPGTSQKSHPSRHNPASLVAALRPHLPAPRTDDKPAAPAPVKRAVKKGKAPKSCGCC